MMELHFISGLADCHITGLYSLVISDRVSKSVGMCRVFYASPECNMDLFDGADFRLKPHNHRQDLVLTKLFGDVENIIVREMPSELRGFCYKFTSALLKTYTEIGELKASEVRSAQWDCNSPKGRTSK